MGVLSHPQPYGGWGSPPPSSPCPGSQPWPLVRPEPVVLPWSPLMGQGERRGAPCTAGTALLPAQVARVLVTSGDRKFQEGKRTPTLSNVTPPHRPTCPHINRLGGNVLQMELFIIEPPQFPGLLLLPGASPALCRHAGSLANLCHEHGRHRAWTATFLLPS